MKIGNPRTMDKKEKDLKSILIENHDVGLGNKPVPLKELRASEWVEIRLFISSTFIDTHSERDVLIKKIIPALNRELKESFITIVPIDLRWGVLKEDSKNCHAIQKTCLDEIDHCRSNKETYPYFLGLRTHRYGWVQDDLMSSDKYNHPKLFGWIQALKKHNKELAITSLECIHSVWLAEELPPAQTVFFYERDIINPENIEEEYKWIFEFEYKDEDMGCQYTKTTKAGVYVEDKRMLNEYLKSLGHVKYTEYKCSYEKGGARITGEKGDKKFGIGYLRDMEDFENKVKADLLSSIKSNFKAADLTQIPPNELRNLPYEEAMKEKSSTFVERDALTNQILTYCTRSTVTSSVMIVKGEPGQGKSALVAFVANKCINDLRTHNTFVFVHGVDTCPQSSDLEQMLLRLHENLCVHVGTQNKIKTSEDLKSKHVRQLEEMVKNNPEQRFIVFVDAVNQFHESMQAHSMWWLPTDKVTPNLRFVISTLPNENYTFANAQKRCHKAEVVNIEGMRKNEGKKMVSTILKRYNKKLTTDDKEEFLGNQMQLLLDKNCTPLYLSAACEALRTFGVYEELTKHIKEFPSTIPELFSSLLERWSNEYGERFISYLVCIITLSRDGLLEDVIADIISYVEKEKNIGFEHSFSHVFSSLRGFFSGGGGGNLRFFHDQLNQVVRKRYLDSSQDFVCEIHQILADFYFEQIRPQLCENPVLLPPLHYSDCLRHVVYHQVLAMKDDEQTQQFEQTLRNIFFVREKIRENQWNELIKEYLFALQYATNVNARSTLESWKKFVVIYAPFINDLPKWSHNMAINQISSSYVYTDTKKLDVKTEHYEEFPKSWVNKPSREQEDHVLLKYRSGMCSSCAATTVNENMVAVSDGNYVCIGKQVWVYDMKTCELLAHFHMECRITYMTFSRDNQLWVGDDGSFVHICDITTGKVVWSSERIGKREDDKVEWLQHVNDNLICGTWQGSVASICTTTRTINTWKTGEQYNWAYHYHHTSELLYICHGSEVMDSMKCWKLGGESVSWYVESLGVTDFDFHPTKENLMACGTIDNKTVQLNILNGAVMWEVEGTTDDCRDVVYTHDGRVVCVDKDNQTLILLDGDGNITNKVKSHSLYVYNIRLVPGTNQLLTAGIDGSYLLDLPTTPDQQYEDDDMQYKVQSFAVLKNRNEIIVLKRDEDYNGVVERWHGDSLETLASVEVKDRLAFHSRIVRQETNDNLVVVCTEKALLFLDTATLETVAKHTAISEDDLDKIHDFTICNVGTKCVVVKKRSSNGSGTSVVYDITNVKVIATLATFGMEHEMYSSDINKDGSKVVCGGEGGIVMYDVTTSQPIKTLREEEAYLVRFVYQPDGVLFFDWNDKLHLMNFEGEITHSFLGQQYPMSPTLLHTTYLVTGNYDNSIQLHDITTQQTVYKFYHPSSDGFTSFAYQPEHNKLFAVNRNGKLYVMK